MIDINDTRFRVRWSELEHYNPIKIRITDWKNLKILYYNYMLVNSVLDYKDRKIELCVPYYLFVRKLRKLPIDQQRWVIGNKAVIEIMKTGKFDRQGMVIKVEEYKEKVLDNKD